MPFTVWCYRTLSDAIGISASIGFPIAVAGSFKVYL